MDSMDRMYNYIGFVIIDQIFMTEDKEDKKYLSEILNDEDRIDEICEWVVNHSMYYDSDNILDSIMYDITVDAIIMELEDLKGNMDYGEMTIMYEKEYSHKYTKLGATLKTM